MNKVIDEVKPSEKKSNLGRCPVCGIGKLNHDVLMALNNTDYPGKCLRCGAYFKVVELNVIFSYKFYGGAL